MPAIVTHDLFGKDALEKIPGLVGSSKDCVDAFLLGNQGPDPLFYLVVDPANSSWDVLGSNMHRTDPDKVLLAMKQAINVVPRKDTDVARAYALGFLCHYLLDSTVHPLVYAQQDALCGAGVPGLTSENGGSVHSTIECEFDEVMLNTRLHTTLKKYNPSKSILHGLPGVLKTISTMYLYTALVVYNLVPPADLFTRGVKMFRIAQTLFYSKNGIKRSIIVHAEERLRTFSSFALYSMHANPMAESAFENRVHDTWVDPADGAERTESFADLFGAALERVEECARLFIRPEFDEADAATITRGLNFNGKPAAMDPEKPFAAE